LLFIFVLPPHRRPSTTQLHVCKHWLLAFLQHLAAPPTFQLQAAHIGAMAERSTVPVTASCGRLAASGGSTGHPPDGLRTTVPGLLAGSGGCIPGARDGACTGWCEGRDGGSAPEWLGGRNFFDDYTFTDGARSEHAAGVNVIGYDSFGVIVAGYPIAGDGRPPVAVKVCRQRYVLSKRAEVDWARQPYKMYQREVTNALAAWEHADAVVQPLLLRVVAGYMSFNGPCGTPAYGRAMVYVVMERLPYIVPTWVATRVARWVPHNLLPVPPLDASVDLWQLAHAGRLTRFAVRKVVEQVLAVLAGMHGSGICHRDIKPDNMLVVGWVADSSGRAFPAIKLTGFSLSRNSGVDGDRLPTADDLGTIDYRAPELRWDKDKVTASHLDRADVYAAGASWVALLRYATGDDDAPTGRIEWPPLPPAMDATRPRWRGSKMAGGVFADAAAELAFRMLAMDATVRLTASEALALMRAAWPDEAAVEVLASAVLTAAPPTTGAGGAAGTSM